MISQVGILGAKAATASLELHKRPDAVERCEHSRMVHETGRDARLMRCDPFNSVIKLMKL